MKPSPCTLCRISDPVMPMVLLQHEKFHVATVLDLFVVKKLKVKLSISLNVMLWTNFDDIDVRLHTFYTLTLNGGMWAASQSGHFIPEQTAPSWMGPRAVLEVLVPTVIWIHGQDDKSTSVSAVCLLVSIVGPEGHSRAACVDGIFISICMEKVTMRHVVPHFLGMLQIHFTRCIVVESS
jgi:hypothetical protein